MEGLQKITLEEALQILISPEQKTIWFKRNEDGSSFDRVIDFKWDFEKYSMVGSRSKEASIYNVSFYKEVGVTK